MERAQSSLLGRDDELARLRIAIESDRLFAVVGEAGIGKTSLVRAAAAASGARLHEGGGFATLVAMPFLALARAVDATLSGDTTRVAAFVERHVGPELLFVDDLQWVDLASLAALELLVGRVNIVLAIREGDPRTDVATSLARRLGFEMLKLGGLDPTSARAIVQRLGPGLGMAEVERVVARAGGNPLVLEEMAAFGEPSPVLTRAIESGIERLSPPGRHLVELMAVADRPLDRDRLGDGIGEAIRAGCVIERLGQVEIRHVLLAETVLSRLDGKTRAALHERVASLVDDPVEAARHLALAGLPSRAASMASAALGKVEDPGKRAALLVVIAEAAGRDVGLEPRLAAARALSDVSDWESVVRILPADVADGSPAAHAERDVLLAHALFSLGRHVEARELLDRAPSFALDPGDPVAARVAIEVAAFMVNVDGQILAAIGYLDERMSHHSPDSPSYHALRAISESVRMLAAMEIDVEYLRGAIEAAVAAQAFASAADLARVVSFAHLIGQGAEPALEFLGDMGKRFERAGAQGVALEFLAEAVQATILAGRPVESVQRADELLEGPAPMRARQTASIFRARALGMMGRLDEATESLARFEGSLTEDFVGRGEWLSAQADLALWGGTADRVVELVRAVMAVPAPIRGAYGLPGITRAWAQYESGLSPEPVADIAPTRIMAGAVPELDGIRLLHEGEPDSAATRFAEAAATWAGFNVPRSLVCRWAEGEALRQAGRREEMAERLEGALDAAIACHFETLAVRVRRSMRQAGMRVPGPDRTPRAFAIGLTRRERELVGLAGDGLTNIEIARRMGLGRPTVARILSNAMTKLGAGSRAHAVILAGDPY